MQSSPLTPLPPHQRGRPADNLALGVVLGSVAWALELVLSLNDSSMQGSQLPHVLPPA